MSMLVGGFSPGVMKVKFSWVFRGSRDLGLQQLERLLPDNPLLLR